jgi:hypothetical protein
MIIISIDFENFNQNVYELYCYFSFIFRSFSIIFMTSNVINIDEIVYNDVLLYPYNASKIKIF